MAVHVGGGRQSAPHARVSLLSLPQDDAGEKTINRTYAFILRYIGRGGGEGIRFFFLASQSERDTVTIFFAIFHISRPLTLAFAAAR